MTELDVSQMTPEQRLKQIEMLLSTAAKTLNRTNEEVKEQRDRTDKLEQSFIQSNERTDKLEQSFIQSNERMDKLEQSFIQSNERMEKLEQNLTIISDLVWSTAKVVAEQREEIRASQAECQRIWEYLTTQNRNGNGNNPQSS